MRRDLLTPRETQVLLMIGGYRYLALSHLEDLLFLGTLTTRLSRNVITRRIVQRLRARGLVAGTARLVGGPAGGSGRAAYYLTPAGAKLASALNPELTPRPLPRRGTFLMQHSLMTADVAVAFRRAAKSHPGQELLDWVGDWQARQRLGTSVLVPDAYFVYATPDVEVLAFLEVDLGTEGSRFFARKMRRYVELFRGGSWREHVDSWPLILVVTTSEQRSLLLRATTQALFEGQADAHGLRLQVEIGFTDVARLIAEGPLASIWRFTGAEGIQTLVPEKSP